MDAGGHTRRAQVRVGANVRGPAPVLFVWHGWGADPGRMMRMVAPHKHWDDAIVVSSQGLPRSFEIFGARREPGWQVQAGEHDDRDLVYFDALLAELDRRYCIDRKRLFTTGFSNGGFFSNLLACERGSIIAAAAPVGGGGPEPDRCTTKVPVLVTHGRRDRVVPFEMARDSFEAWSRHNGCETTAVPTQGCANAGSCDADVAACVHSGGHLWPATTAASIAKFLKAH